MIQTKEHLIQVLIEGPEHRDHNCDVCGWCEEEAYLTLCKCCEGRLVCIECRSPKGMCVACAEFDLPPEVKLVGQLEKCDLVFSLTSYIGVLGGFASHYYVNIKERPYQKYGRLDMKDFTYRSLRTEKIDLTGPYVRRILKVIVKKHMKAIKRRKEGRLYVHIESKDIRAQLMKLNTINGD